MNSKKLSKETLKYHATDAEYQTYTIKNITPIDNNTINIETTEGSHIYCPTIKDFTPQPGMTAKFYGKGLGYTVRGIEIDGHIMRYLTPKQEDKEHQKWCKQHTKEQKKNFSKNKKLYEKQYNSLPLLLKERMDVLRKKSPTDRFSWEPYELFILTQANEITKYLTTIDAIQKWKDMDWKLQKQQVPTLDDGHSGNTFECAISFAKYIINQRQV